VIWAWGVGDALQRVKKVHYVWPQLIRVLAAMADLPDPEQYVGSASATVTLMSLLCTLRTQISYNQYTINMQLRTLQEDKEDEEEIGEKRLTRTYTCIHTHNTHK
jgi:hypothetical protein